LRLLPHPRLLDRRPALVVARDRADPRRGGDGGPRLRDRPPLPLAARGLDRRTRLDAAAVPRLARRPRQPRDPRPAPRRGDVPARARRRTRALVAARRRARRRERRRGALERAAPPPAAGARRLPGLASGPVG